MWGWNELEWVDTGVVGLHEGMLLTTNDGDLCSYKAVDNLKTVKGKIKLM